MKIEQPAQKSRLFGREIFEDRKIIRDWGGISKENSTFTPLGDYKGKKNIWNPKFVYFYETCEQNMHEYYKSYLNNEIAALRPVFPLLHGNNAFKASTEDWKKTLISKTKALPAALLRHYKKEIDKADTTLRFIEIDGCIEEEFRDLDAREREREDYLLN